MNADEETQLIRILEDFEDLFDGYTVSVDLNLKPGSKIFNSKYYLVSRANKETFHKELKILVKTGVLTPVQQNKYGTPIFIVPKK